MKLSSSSVQSMVYGSLGFGLVSVIAYSIWAFRLVRGPGLLFAAVALAFMVLSGPALSRLVATKGSTLRFSLTIGIAFLAYAVVWCVFWFGLKGKYNADLFGSMLGIAALTWIIQRWVGQGKARGFLSNCGVVFLFHTLGYFLGNEVYSQAPGSAGRLLWGAVYGLGFGAGLGYLLFQCQAHRNKYQ